MVAWIVHAVGEADLGLASTSGPVSRSVAERTAAFSQRLASLATMSEAEREEGILGGRWHDGLPVVGRRPPLPRAVEAVSGQVAGPAEVRVVLLGVDGEFGGSRFDTARLAACLADLLTSQLAARDTGLSTVTFAPISAASLSEPAVVAALVPLLIQVGPPALGDVGARVGHDVVVTWGSGATALSLGAVSAAVRSGHDWSLLDLTDDGDARFVGGRRAGSDPVVPVLIRWRLFAELAQLSARSEPDSPARLTSSQLAVVQRLADLGDLGLRGASADALLAVLVDSVVRRDGTSGLAVRRYIYARYAELLELDRRLDPAAVDLLHWSGDDATSAGRSPLGRQLAQLQKARHRLPVDLGRTSGRWLTGPGVRDLNDLGRRSHELASPPVALAARVAEFLAGELTSAAEPALRPDALAHSGLPSPPSRPQTAALVVWAVGREDHRPSIAEQVLRDGVDLQVRAHLEPNPGSASITVQALLLASPQTERLARRQAAHLTGEVGARHPALGDIGAHVQIVEPAGFDAAWARRLVEARLTADTGALVLVPTGPKAVVLELVQAMSGLSAELGLPLYVREIAHEAGIRPGMHVWPQITAGDGALLTAVGAALDRLELDTAWRLLMATSHAPSLGVRCLQLATAFAGRRLQEDDVWPLVDDHVSPQELRRRRSLGLIDQRIDLVRYASTRWVQAPGMLVRALVLAATAVEVSLTGFADLPADSRFRGQVLPTALRRLKDIADRDGPASSGPGAESEPVRQAARMLLLLNDARDRAPTTHGDAGDADEAIAQAIAAAGHGQPLTLDGLLAAATSAAGVLRGPIRPPFAASLTSLYQGLRSDLVELGAG